MLGPKGAAINMSCKKQTSEDVQFYNPASLRGAAATSALIGGATKKGIRCQARWADIKTFNRHYNRARQMATPLERQRMESVASSGRGWPLHLALRRGVGARYVDL